MATFKELSENVGKIVQAKIPIDGFGSALNLNCEVIDCRIVFGRTDYQLKYEDQTFWLSKDRVKINETL